MFIILTKANLTAWFFFLSLAKMIAEIESNANIIENQTIYSWLFEYPINEAICCEFNNIKKTKTVEENIIDINVVENTFLLFFSFTENLKNAVSIPYVKIIVKNATYA